jgi:hypothetical protein
MEFLNPSALFGLFALPLLLIPYLIRRKPRREVFSSLLLFMTGAERTSSRSWGRINLPPIFFLQLLLLALLIFALSEPVFSVRPTNIAVILDNSASMQALEDSKTRFVLAKERAGEIIDDLGAAGTVDLYVTAPGLAKLRPTPLAPAEAKSAVGTLAAYDLGDPPIDYDTALGQLARERKYERVYLITDHPARGQSAATRVISVGAPRDNRAVTAFDVQRSSLADARLQASVEVGNFSSQDEKLRVLLKSDGKTLMERQLVVSAGKTATVAFEGFAEHGYYEAEIDGRDALPLDNRRSAVLPASHELKILAITPRPQAATSLRSIPGISVDVIAPEDYEKSPRTGYGLEIFHFSAPEALPQNPALFILPPESSPLVQLGAPTTNVNVSGWREPHVLTRYINFSLFRPPYARPLTPQIAGEVVIEITNGALVIAHERQSGRYLTVGFDPLPYLGRGNLPMSIFTLNFLDWFLQGAGATGQATGEPIPLGATQQGDLVVTPSGQKISLTVGRNSFTGTYQQGIYQVITRSRGAHLFARNLRDAYESDLRSPATIELKGTSVSGASASVLFSFWPYLLIASLLLLLLEWFINPRPKALAFGRKPGRMAWRS